MIRSFFRWRRASPRPTLWQWIRGYRGSLYVEGRHVGFTKNFKVSLQDAKTEPHQGLRSRMGLDIDREAFSKIFGGDKEQT